MFLFWLSKIDGRPTNVLSAIGKAIEAKLRLPCIQYDDKIEAACREARRSPYGKDHTALVTMPDGSHSISPISVKAFKEAYNKLPEPKAKLPSDTSIRRTLKRRGQDVSGKPGKPKKILPRLPPESRGKHRIVRLLKAVTLEKAKRS
jgi:hypothetical protein